MAKADNPATRRPARGLALAASASAAIILASALLLPPPPAAAFALAPAVPSAAPRPRRLAAAPPAAGGRVPAEDDAVADAVADAVGPPFSPGVSRRGALGLAASAAASLSRPPIPPPAASAAEDGVGTARGEPVRMSASWTATSGLKTDEGSGLVSFDASAYRAMRDDPSRTPLFRKALAERLGSAPGGPGSQTVLDLGTGPFALFAVMAAEAGAGRVYAIEADPEAARNARQVIKSLGYSDVITVLDGFSADVTLPGGVKADVVVAEVVGSVASEEGAYATVLDAHRRFLKDPDDPGNWIPNRVQTYAAPASYTLHNLFAPPEFDWTKIAAEPVRFNCRDMGLQLLSDPVVVEDISFADVARMSDQRSRKAGITFRVDGERVEDNTSSFYEEYRKGRLPASQASALARQAARSVSGIALWPRLYLPRSGEGTYTIDSRRFPDGGHQRSHWQTVLPVMGATPAFGLRGGDEIVVEATFDLPAKVDRPPRYRIDAEVYASG